MADQDVIFLNSVFFVLGFILVFSALGILFQTLLLHISFSAMTDLRTVGGIIIVIFGIMLIASAKYIIPFFSVEHKVHPKKFKNSYLSSLVFGIAFALGWTPCVGAILGSIYALAATSPGLSFLLLLAYSLGLGIPFLIFGAFISKASGFLAKIRPWLRYFNVVGGAFLLILGALVITGYIGTLAIFLIGSQGPMSLDTTLNFLVALVAGLLTFFSPCILPLIPAYFSYMAGTTAEEVRK